MIELEGVVGSTGRARELGGGNMSLHFMLSSWRRLDRAENEPGRAIVTIESDLDWVDAWMRDLGPGDVVRINGATVSPPDENGDVHIRAVGEPMDLIRARGR